MREDSAIYSSPAGLGVFKKVPIYAAMLGNMDYRNLLRAAGGTGEWQLFNLKADSSETHDLAKDQPERLKELVALWDEYARNNGVILTGDGPFKRGKEASVVEDLGD